MLDLTKMKGDDIKWHVCDRCTLIVDIKRIYKTNEDYFYETDGSVKLIEV